MGEIKMKKCSIVRQLPNHCVTACIVSVLHDVGIEATQVELVNQYSEIFPNGVLDDVNKPYNLERVFIDYGLTDRIYRVSYNLYALRDFHNNDNIVILLMWTKQAKHCIRFCGFTDDTSKVIVMDPEHDVLQTHPISWLDSVCPDIIYFELNGKLLA
jgi:hypothetical protein